MPNKKQIQNMLFTMNVRELRQISKYFGVPVTKQSGGYHNKNRLVDGLVGGMLKRWWGRSSLHAHTTTHAAAIAAENKKAGARQLNTPPRAAEVDLPAKWRGFNHPFPEFSVTEVYKYSDNVYVIGLSYNTATTPLPLHGIIYYDPSNDNITVIYKETIYSSSGMIATSTTDGSDWDHVTFEFKTPEIGTVIVSIKYTEHFRNLLPW